MTEPRRPPIPADPPKEEGEFRMVYCDNRRCRHPVGKARLTPGSVVSFPCRHCGQRTVVVA